MAAGRDTITHPKSGVAKATSFFTSLTRSTMIELDDGIEQPADGYGNPYAVDEADPGYQVYRGPSQPRALQSYQEMLEQDWVDEPLRELLETRVSDLLEG